MINLFRRYKEMSFEQRTVLHTVIGLCFSTVFACGKFILGLFSDYNLCIIAVYTIALLLSKLECVLGVKSQKLSFKTRNILLSCFLLLSSIVYIAFMCRMFFIDRKVKEYGLNYVVIVAFISFAELGFAIAGILRTKNKSHFYRAVKIINFCIGLIAILTTQITILDFCAESGADFFNACTGVGVGCTIAILAVYILVMPKISVVGREHNAFILKDEAENKLVNMQNSLFEIPLCNSKIYAPYIYRADICGDKIDGYIQRGESLWKRMHIILKILCCILSELLIFVWFAGRFIFFIRSANLPKQLEKLMLENGFVKLD